MQDSRVNITVIDREGVAHQLEAPTDMNMNLMELCKSYELPIEGLCGGMAMCATCQVYVLSEQVSLEKNPDEQAMLDEAYNVKPNSRLSCQIYITEALDGLTVELAPVHASAQEKDQW